MDTTFGILVGLNVMCMGAVAAVLRSRRRLPLPPAPPPPPPPDDTPNTAFNFTRGNTRASTVQANTGRARAQTHRAKRPTLNASQSAKRPTLNASQSAKRPTLNASQSAKRPTLIATPHSRVPLPRPLPPSSPGFTMSTTHIPAPAMRNATSNATKAHGMLLGLPSAPAIHPQPVAQWQPHAKWLHNAYDTIHGRVNKFLLTPDRTKMMDKIYLIFSDNLKAIGEYIRPIEEISELSLHAWTTGMADPHCIELFTNYRLYFYSDIDELKNVPENDTLPYACRNRPNDMVVAVSQMLFVFFVFALERRLLTNPENYDLGENMEDNGTTMNVLWISQNTARYMRKMRDEGDVSLKIAAMRLATLMVNVNSIRTGVTDEQIEWPFTTLKTKIYGESTHEQLAEYFGGEVLNDLITRGLHESDWYVPITS